jgi:hypothetical protein
MPFIPLPESLRVAMNFSSQGGNNATNVIYVRDALGEPDATRAQELADIIDGWATTGWAPVASNQWTFDSVEVTDASNPEGVSASALPGEPGDLTASPLPAQDTVALSLRTGKMGRSNRGRLYFVGLTEEAIADGVLQTLAETNIINAYQALRSLLIADDFSWGVASFVTGGAPRVAGIINPVTDIIVTDSLIDRQLRRKRQ